MRSRQPRRRAPNFQSSPNTQQDTGFRTLPITEYEAIYGSVGEFQHAEGGIVEFVLESPGRARFIRVLKDGKPYNILRWPD